MRDSTEQPSQTAVVVLLYGYERRAPEEVRRRRRCTDVRVVERLVPVVFAVVFAAAAVAG